MIDLVPDYPIISARAKPLENEARLVSAINQVADPEFAPYLQEVWRCYNSQSYTSAIIWVWCVVSRYIRTVVQNVGEDAFRFQLVRTYESLDRVNDEELVEACRKLGILNLADIGRFGWVNNLRSRRNELAHGTWQAPVVAKEVIDWVEIAIQHFLIRPAKDHVLTLSLATVYDMAQSYEQPISQQQVETWINAVMEPSENLLNLCHRLTSLYASGEAENLENVRLFWCSAYKRLAEKQRVTVVSRTIADLAESLELRTSLEESQWVVVPVSGEDVHKARSEDRLRAMLDISLWMLEGDIPAIYHNGYYEVLVYFLQGETESETGSNFQPRYFKKIREYAPEKYKTKVEELIAQLL